MSVILTAACIDPLHCYQTAEIIDAANRFWLTDLDEKTKSYALRLFQGAEIRQRYSALPLEVVFRKLSFQEKNNLYIEAAKEMAERALRSALEKARLAPKQLDYLITTSCTGFMIPSVDAYLVDRLGLRQDVVRIPITEMGCAGGSSGLTYAHRLLRGHPGGHAAVVAVEVPSITFQRDDLSVENLVSTAIFADGAAAVLLRAEGEGLRILDTEMYHFPQSTHLMGYELRDSGLKIILDREVPAAISSHFDRYFYPLLERQQLTVADVEHFLFHPGGKKILSAVEGLLGKHGKNLRFSRKVLTERGNLSSATVLYVLNQAMQEARTGEYGYMLAFGPGFTAQSLLLQW